MPRVFNFVYCNNAETMNDNGSPVLNVFGVLPVFSMPWIPGTFSFSIALNISDIDFNIPHNLKINVVDRDGKIISYIEIPAPPTPTAPNGEPTKVINAVLNFRNVEFIKKGIYITKIIIDEREIAEYPIEVVEKVAESVKA